MTTPHPAMQPPSYFMQHPQASGMVQQASPAGIFPPRGPLQFGSPHQLQDPQHQQQQQIHQQAMQGHMGLRPMGINNNGMQQPETSLGVSNANGNSLHYDNTQFILVSWWVSAYCKF